MEVCSARPCSFFSFVYMAGMTQVIETGRRAGAAWVNSEPVLEAKATWKVGVSEKVALVLVW